MSENGRDQTDVILGPDLLSGQLFHTVVHADVWQAARPVDDWVLVGCTVSPAFEFDSFVMAPDGWAPGKAL